MAEPSFFAVALVSLFVVLDPFANVPLFSNFLRGFSHADFTRAVRLSHIVAIVAFFFFSFFGSALFDFLKIEFSSFKIAGGLLLFFISVEMLFGFKTRTEMTLSEQQSAEEKENVAVTPLAIPLLTGPGAIITGIVLFSRAQALGQVLDFVLACAIAFMASFLVLFSAERISKLFGVIGMKLVTRIMGLILMSLSVQFIINGIREAGLIAVGL